MATTYQLISSQTLGTSASSVVLSSIPQTYTDLLIKVSSRSDNAQQVVSLILKINTDTGTNYSRTFVYADGSGTASTGQNSNVTVIGMAGGTNGATSTANTFSNFEMYIPNYKSTTSKAMSASAAPEHNASTMDNGDNQQFAALWRGSTTITDLTFTTNGSFVAGSSFYLYGIKNS